MRPFRMGLALGGGAARGYAHLGILKTLESNDVPIDCITGTSMGAVMGGLYAWFGSVRETVDHMRRFLSNSKVVNLAVYQRIVESEKKKANIVDNLTAFIRRGILYGKAMTSKSVVDPEIFNEAFQALVPDVDIRDSQIPFGAVASNLVTGEELMITGGSLRTALMASSAIPGIYPPVVSGEMILIDGGWTNKIPVDPCFQLGAAQVIACCVSREMEDTRDFDKAMDIIARSNAVSTNRLGELQKRGASLVLEPEVSDIHWADFSRFDDSMDAGFACAEENLERIMKVAARAKWQRWIKSKKKFIREITL
jgi:NTE family protein